jgi:GNAT superfamily N-acetyltransferase
LLAACTQEQQNKISRDIQNWTGTNGVLEVYAGDKLVRRFIKIDKLTTAMGTDDNKARPYRYGYGVLDENFNMHGFVLESDGQVLGIANASFRNSTWSENQELYLEDLLVDQSHRGKGFGRALIEAVADSGKQHGAPKLYWQTHRDNATAQKLYDSLATKSEFITYDKPL